MIVCQTDAMKATRAARLGVHPSVVTMTMAIVTTTEIGMKFETGTPTMAVIDATSRIDTTMTDDPHETFTIVNQICDVDSKLLNGNLQNLAKTVVMTEIWVARNSVDRGLDAITTNERFAETIGVRTSIPVLKMTGHAVNSQSPTGIRVDAVMMSHGTDTIHINVRDSVDHQIATTDQTEVRVQIGVQVQTEGHGATGMIVMATSGAIGEETISPIAVKIVANRCMNIDPADTAEVDSTIIDQATRDIATTGRVISNTDITVALVDINSQDMTTAGSADITPGMAIITTVGMDITVALVDINSQDTTTAASAVITAGMATITTVGMDIMVALVDINSQDTITAASAVITAGMAIITTVDTDITAASVDINSQDMTTAASADITAGMAIITTVGTDITAALVDINSQDTTTAGSADITAGMAIIMVDMDIMAVSVDINLPAADMATLADLDLADQAISGRRWAILPVDTMLQISHECWVRRDHRDPTSSRWISMGMARSPKTKS